MIDESAYPKEILKKLKKIAKTTERLEDLLYQWDERCGMRQFSGGQPFATAARCAIQEILARVAAETKDEEEKS